MIGADVARFLYRAWRYRWKLEREEIRFALAHLEPGDTAVDIGAHKGGYAYWLHRAVSPGGRVVCFEPQPELARYLARMKQRLRLEQLEVEPVAVSSRGGEVRLDVPGGGTSPAARLDPADHESAPREGDRGRPPLLVRATTLDDHFAATAPVRLIKCDVEGHELEVFRGGERLLRRQRPILMFECEDRHLDRHSPRDVFAFLEALGYQGFFVGRGGLRLLEEFDPQRHGVPGRGDYANNFVFRPRGDC